MYGALFGDYVGSIYEHHNIKTKDFPLLHPDAGITDDSYMTIAVASACLGYARHGDLDRFTEEVAQEMIRIGRNHPHPIGGYGKMFRQWLYSGEPRPYGSYGNGSAMRVSPCAWVAQGLNEAEKLGAASAMPTHDHPEGIKGAQAVAGAIWLARVGTPKVEITRYVESRFYRLNKSLAEYRSEHHFSASCQGTVPPAIRAFLESNGFEDAIRNAVSLGGDSDTLAAITGSIAEAYYGMPENLRQEVERQVRFHCDKSEETIVTEFAARFCGPRRKETRK